MAPVLLFRCRRPATRTICYVFCVMGGFYCANVVTRVAGRAWLVYNVLSSLYGILIGPVGYLLTAAEILPSDLLYTATFAMCHTFATVYTPLISYYFGDELTAILRNVDDELGCSQPEARSTDTTRKRYDSAAIARNWLVWMLSLMAMLSVLRPVYTTLTCDRSCVASQRVYIEATPFVERVHSLDVYLSISVLESVHVILAAIVPSCAITFGLMIGYEFHNICVNLSVRLQHVIDDAVANVRSSRRKPRSRPATHPPTESQMFEQFKADLSLVVQRYQAVTRAVERVRIWIQILCSVNLINFLFIETLFAYLAIDSRFGPLLRFQSAAGVVGMGTTTYGICLLGGIFADINDMLVNELYSTGWYELPPKYRKMMHIFHSQLRKPIQFYAFFVYPVTMATFARAVRFVYSVISLLRRAHI